MEETWMTTRWPNRVFCFLLAVTVVNVQNAGVYFCGLPKVDVLEGAVATRRTNRQTVCS